MVCRLPVGIERIAGGKKGKRSEACWKDQEKKRGEIREKKRGGSWGKGTPKLKKQKNEHTQQKVHISKNISSYECRGRGYRRRGGLMKKCRKEISQSSLRRVRGGERTDLGWQGRGRGGNLFRGVL